MRAWLTRLWTRVVSNLEALGYRAALLAFALLVLCIYYPGVRAFVLTPGPIFLILIAIMLVAGALITKKLWLAAVPLGIVVVVCLISYIPSSPRNNLASSTQGILPHHFGTTPGTPLNPGGIYSIYFWHDGHCLYFRQSGSDKRLGPYCAGSYPPFIEYAWSADTPFDGQYQLFNAH